MKEITISVVGVGRVGLPLALVLANEGLNIFGIGRNQEKIKSLNKKIMPLFFPINRLPLPSLTIE